MVRDLVSVIVPVSNSEKYLAECINSILKSENVLFEIIAVLNGSHDGSKKILNVLAKDPRLSIIETDILGVSHARNIGIRNAVGEFITFVDSDDKILPNHLADLVNHMADGEIDLVCTRYKNSYGDLYSSTQFKILSKKELIFSIMNNEITGGFVHNKIFRSSVLKSKNIYFPENVSYFEDLDFVFSYIQVAKKAILLGEATYYYRMHDNSYVNSFTYFRIVNPNSITSLQVFEKIQKSSYVKNVGMTNYVKSKYLQKVAQMYRIYMNATNYTELSVFWIIYGRYLNQI